MPRTKSCSWTTAFQPPTPPPQLDFGGSRTLVDKDRQDEVLGAQEVLPDGPAHGLRAPVAAGTRGEVLGGDDRAARGRGDLRPEEGEEVAMRRTYERSAHRPRTPCSSHKAYFFPQSQEINQMSSRLERAMSGKKRPVDHTRPIQRCNKTTTGSGRRGPASVQDQRSA